jgi:tRNA(Ile)-lysidine synthase
VDLPSILAHFLDSAAPLERGERLLVAFSGGPDSTALLCGLSRLRRERGLALTAVHLDHGLDPGSAGRARAAARLAAALEVDLVEERRDVPALRRLSRSTESLEAAARRVRYEVLEEVRERLGARWVATAHHLDDQAETVLLRLRFGTGLEGLAGIRPVHGRVIRPLLGVRREELRRYLEAAAPELVPVEDPTNDDLRPWRNRVRHLLLPVLATPAAAAPDLPERLARLAERARRGGAALDARLARILALEPL